MNQYIWINTELETAHLSKCVKINALHLGHFEEPVRLNSFLAPKTSNPQEGHN